MRYYLASLCAFLSFACVDHSLDVSVSEPIARDDSAKSAWSFEQVKISILDRSCSGVTGENIASATAPVALDVTPLAWPASGYEGADFSGLELAGVWQLSSGSADFGAFSGLVETVEGHLLLISDTGRWLQLELDETRRTPLASALPGRMRGHDGQILAGKRQADAEGLAVRDGIALVSFEHDHRVSAFAIGACGLAAREVPLSRIADEPVTGLEMARNGGAEGLSIAADGSLWLGIETPGEGVAAVGRLLADGRLEQVDWRALPAGYRLTGLDMRDGQTAAVFRFYRPGVGNRIFFTVHGSGETFASGRLAPPAPVDNLEGIAFGKAPSGGDRLWLISDDNISRRQRTLLFAFDLE